LIQKNIEKKNGQLNILLRIGKILLINYDVGTVTLCLENKYKIVTNDLPMFFFEYYMPDVGNPAPDG
jgi:hypothetical protein